MVRLPRPSAVTLALALALAVGVTGACAPKETSTVVVERRDVRETAVASGRVVAPARIEVGVVGAGVVAEVKVGEGQTVKAGDVLLRLDDRVEVAAVAQARAALAQARARLVEVRQLQRGRAGANLMAADAELQRAQSTLARTKKLADGGASTTVDLEGATTAVQLAQAKRDAAAVDVAANADDGAQVRLAEAQVDAAQAALQTAEARLAQTRVTALVDAVVLQRKVEPGEAVFAGRILMVLGKTSELENARMEIVVEPDEKNLAVLAVGQTADCAADAFVDRPFTATVKEISPLVDRNRGTVEVRLSVPEPPAFLRSDMTVSVEITTGEKKNALVVPLQAVRDLATKNPFVLTINSGVAEKTAVTLGARGSDVVEVLSGLADGAVVVQDPKVKVGAKVKSS
jgi:HlyD family secretion protein